VEIAAAQLLSIMRANPEKGFLRDELQRESQLGRETMNRGLAFLVLTNQTTETSESTGAPGVAPMVYRLAACEQKPTRDRMFRDERARRFPNG